MLYGKGKDIGEIFMVISFDLIPECENHPEITCIYIYIILNIIKAVDTIGKVIVAPKKATLQRDTNWIFGTMNPVCLVRLGSDS